MVTSSLFESRSPPDSNNSNNNNNNNSNSSQFFPKPTNLTSFIPDKRIMTTTQPPPTTSAPVSLTIFNIPRDVSTREFRILFTFAPELLYIEYPLKPDENNTSFYSGRAYFKNYSAANQAHALLDQRADIFPNHLTPYVIPLKCTIQTNNNSSTKPTNNNINNSSQSKFMFSSTAPTSLDMPPLEFHEDNNNNNNNNNNGNNVFSPTSPRSFFPMSTMAPNGGNNEFIPRGKSVLLESIDNDEPFEFRSGSISYLNSDDGVASLPSSIFSQPTNNQQPPQASSSSASSSHQSPILQHHSSFEGRIPSSIDLNLSRPTPTSTAPLPPTSTSTSASTINSNQAPIGTAAPPVIDRRRSSTATATLSTVNRQMQQMSISNGNTSPTNINNSINNSINGNSNGNGNANGNSNSNNNDPTKIVVAYSPTNNNAVMQQVLQNGGRVLPPANPADQNPPCNTLYVGNLPPDASEDELKSIFSTRQGYKRLCFRNKGNGPMCFVEFEDIAFATKSLEELYGYGLSNSVKGGIRLSYSKNPLGVRSNSVAGTNPNTNNTNNSNNSININGNSNRPIASTTSSTSSSGMRINTGIRYK